jgi:5-methyltetrahydropteroyltriglutamate--homocysteine methyltransferase
MAQAVSSLISTTVIGSYPQPNWLVDMARLREHIVPRARADDIWRVDPHFLKQAQDDATVIAIRDMERAGIDTITDGEIRRESYSNRFILGLEGVDVDPPAQIEPMPGMVIDVPRVTGPLRRVRPIEVEDMTFLRANTDRQVKITLPGPFTLAQQAADEFYHDPEALAMAFADVINQEALALQAAGADVIQLDEPWLRNDPAAAERFAVPAIDRAFRGITVKRAVHLCFGYAWIAKGEKPKAYPFLDQLVDSSVDQISIEAAQPGLDLHVLEALRGKTIILGVLDLASDRPDTVDEVAGRLRAALAYVQPDHLIAGPDCGMKYLPRTLAFAKLQALAEGATKVRREVNG